MRDPEGWPPADPRCLTESERASIEYELIYMVVIAIGQLETLEPGLLGSEMVARQREREEQEGEFFASGQQRNCAHRG